MLKLAVVGTGSFAQCFIPLFKAHPLVGELSLSDLNAEKLEENRRQHEIARTFPSLDAVLESDVDAVAIITQNWMHGPQAIQALRAGKHVYSAVPAGITVDEIRGLVDAVNDSGRIYMIGETSSYYPGAVYCRRRYAEGAFGKVVYAEGEYFHDWDHGLYDVMKWRGGEKWKDEAGSPPMYYPTHSTGGIVSILRARMTHVSCQGFVDVHEDGIYAPGANRYDNRFSCQSALFHMSNGSICRINEFRRIGHPSVERMSMYGTDGCFQNSLAGEIWTDKDGITRLDDLLRCGRHDGYADMSLVHEFQRLPKQFRNLPNGHQGSHQFLVDDFVKAVAAVEQPLNNVWQAARYVLPGIVANESSRRCGELLEIPDFGDPA